MLRLAQELRELKVEELNTPSRVNYYHEAMLELQNKMNELMSLMKPPSVVFFQFNYKKQKKRLMTSKSHAGIVYITKLIK